MRIAIINYGAGNVQSLQFAFKRLGYSALLTSDPEELRNAEKVIFPGVGEASSAMAKLKEAGLDSIIPQLKQPVLGICLGMQLLCLASEENNTKGLGVFNTSVKKFPKSEKVPQIGWNTIYNLKSPLFKGIKENEYVYLVHSYYAPLCEDLIASCDYGEPYSVALQKDNFFGLQFHPEKSSLAGERILQNFLNL